MLTPAYIENLEARYRTDPSSIDSSWRCVFDLIHELEIGDSAFMAGLKSAVLRSAYREHGHLAATLDPLSTKRRSPLSLEDYENSESSARLVALWRKEGYPGIQRWMQSVYGGTLSVETGHIDDHGLIEWIHEALGSADSLPDETSRRRALDLLVAAEEFERFMSAKFPAKKRFGAEGAESVVPLLDKVLRDAAEKGVTDVVIGTMHRCRLNLMANVLGKSLCEIIREFKGAHPFPDAPHVAADVPYHLGNTARVSFGERALNITLLPNPSHLEAVNSVVLGHVRARQDQARAENKDPRNVLGIILHTDASVVAQGVVAEGIQLSGVAGYGTAGTIHIVINNQIGFTTDEREARTSRYCTGAWKAVDSLILHVNADDPAAVLKSAGLAVEFRQTHARDVAIDLVCYRRGGHNELDEPRFTHPLRYQLIDAHPSVVALASQALLESDVDGNAQTQGLATKWQAHFQELYVQATDRQSKGASEPVPSEHVTSEHVTSEHAPSGTPSEADSGLPVARLEEIISSLSAPPEGMVLNPKIERIVRQRALSREKGVSWPVAEAVALGSLLLDGINVRLTGQDVVRGAFSQRHFAVIDSSTGLAHVSLNHLRSDQGYFDVVNSPLSEYAVLGFEYGYSLARPNDLVIWEAQFGDFANGAQIMIDQFVASGAEKWRQRSGLVISLPHGLEGQGPEHSSARPERFLQLAAGGNLQIANPSTPANYFHLLRRQVRRSVRKPLILFNTKSLLRLPAAISPLAALGPGTAFQPVLTSAPHGSVEHVLICTGKIAYELERERAETQAENVAIIRLEMLYPFPEEELLAEVRKWPNARYTWVQEEPRNAGAWTYVDRRIETILMRAQVAQVRWGCVSRDECPSPSGSFHSNHDVEQRQLVIRAFAAGRQ